VEVRTAPLVDSNGLSQRIALTQPGTLMRVLRCAMPLANASAQVSTEIVLPSGPGRYPSILLKAVRSFLASCTSGVSIHAMCALPTWTPR
jgi:hypothetical protein